jgi:Kef-type K+ transport system membrane component KefB
MITRTRVLVVVLFAALVLAAIAGPGHVWTIVLIVAGAFVAIVLLGVIVGVRDGFARTRDEAASDGGDRTPRGL